MTKETTMDKLAVLGTAAMPPSEREAVLARILRSPRSSLPDDLVGEQRPPHLRRTMLLAGAGTVAVAASFAGVTLAVMGGGAPGIPAPGGVTMKLGSYALRLPKRYVLTDATSLSCKPYAGFGLPSKSSPSPVSPTYAPEVASAATAAGGCIFMVLAPPYTPTASRPDPEAPPPHVRQAVQVGSYNALVFVPTGSNGSYFDQLELYVEIPIGDGEMQDLVVGEQGLSEPELISVVANGLSVSTTTPASTTSTVLPEPSTAPTVTTPPSSAPAVTKPPTSAPATR